MIIHLNEIPQEGKQFSFDRHADELAEILKDVIGDRPFETEFTIRPAGQAFDLSGQIIATQTLTCSFCAEEFEREVKEKFHEILMSEDDSKSKIVGFENDASFGEVEITHVPNLNQFDVGQVIYQVVAISEPTQPLCKPDCKGLCPHCGENRNYVQCRCAEDKKLADSAFSVLKNLKLN